MIAAAILCLTLTIHDGDGLRCNGRTIRLSAIDAPELRGSPACSTRRRGWHDCDFAAGARSRAALIAMTRGRDVSCVAVGPGGYGRVAARCSTGGIDLGCAMIARGFARARYGDPACVKGSHFGRRSSRAGFLPATAK